MQIYLVGGAVRDTLLALPVRDRDWVVVGATAQQMVTQGYLPVGRDFPVFLHPQTHQEYALARTERSTAPGYRGFAIHAAPDVTLEQDLGRRDLTINAIAVALCELDADGAFDPVTARLEDPFGGRRDLQDGVLRHVTDAFQEDPVRILRVARFAARFHRFAVADATMALMRRMVDAGEVDALVAERVWQELARGLMENTPARMLDTLDACGALARLLPELTAGKVAGGGISGHGAEGGTAQQLLERAAAAQAPLTVRFAALALCMPSDLLRQQACERLRVPNDCRQLALLAAREQAAIASSMEMDAPALLHLFERCDALRKPARFAELLLLCAILAGESARDYRPATRLQQALDAATAIATAPIARAALAGGATGLQVGERIQVARIAAIATAIDAG